MAEGAKDWQQGKVVVGGARRPGRWVGVVPPPTGGVGDTEKGIQ